jgi:hypothetical protein
MRAGQQNKEKFNPQSTPVLGQLLSDDLAGGARHLLELKFLIDVVVVDSNHAKTRRNQMGR